MDSKNLEIKHEKEISDDLTLQIISKSNEKLDCCYDKNGPNAQIGNEHLWNAIAQLKYKGTKLRLITEITKENIAYCKTMMRYFDVHHIDGVKGNFGISDGCEYVGNILPSGKNNATDIIHINIKSFVDLQQYLFDTLWNISKSAKEKIKEIELGLDKEFVETITKPLESQNLLLNLLRSATHEILILFSTVNSFFRAEREGVLQALKEAVERGVNVRLLVPTDDDAVKEISEKELKEKKKQIYIQYICKPLQTNIVTLIIDQAISLSIEITDDSKETFQEATGVATFSNTDSTVSSSASIFESLWIQSELDKQNTTKQVYFQVFKGYGLKDETYKRRWQNSQNK
jgi:phospholipase D-like protein